MGSILHANFIYLNNKSPLMKIFAGGANEVMYDSRFLVS